MGVRRGMGEDGVRSGSFGAFQGINNHSSGHPEWQPQWGHPLVRELTHLLDPQLHAGVRAETDAAPRVAAERVRGGIAGSRIEILGQI